jgi:glycosyltransferase involved in cell wall biosynthesis
MRVYIEYDLDNESGKGKFVQRMCREWQKMGVEYSDQPEGCTVRLAITRYRTKCKLPTALRIDGSHHEFNLESAKYKLPTKEILKKLKWKNGLMADNIKASDAVIWQSHFCRSQGRKVFKVKPKIDYVVFNGADPADYRHEPKKDKIVFMSAKWLYRPHKRLKEMLEIAAEYWNLHNEVRFIVAGNNEEKSGCPGVLMVGHVAEDVLRSLISSASCMLNLAYYDWCPNAVVEALVGGMPVICANGTGVAEIVKDSGIVLNLDKPDHDVMRRGVPPPFDYAPVYNALDRILYHGAVFPPAEHLYIDRIARDYADILRSISK